MSIDIDKLAHRYEELRSERANWESTWRECAELFNPGRYRDDTETNAHRIPLVNPKLVNSKGILAMRSMASGMQGGMASPVRPWFRLVAKGDPQRIPDGVNAWLDRVTQAMTAVLHQSNFYNATHTLYSDIGTFGTGLLVETANEDGIYFHLVRCGEYVLDINGNDEVDTFFRRLYMTPRQILDRWERAPNLPDFIKRSRERKVMTTERYDVIHAVFPRTDFKPAKRLTVESKPFASVYYLPGGSSGHGTGKACILEEGGFDMFPAFAPRWDVSGSDVYGRSPVMDVLPDCKMLQAMTTTLRKTQHKIADPPLVADQSLRATGVKLIPGGLSFFDSTRTGTTPVAPIHQPEAAALQTVMTAIQEVEQNIDDGLYVDLFRMMLEDQRSRITATEINAKERERIVMLGPVVERLHKELFDPVIRRTFALMQEWGAMPTPPEGVDALDVDVSFESALAQAQRQVTTSNIEAGFAFIGQAAAAVPEILDIVDTDAMGRAYLDRINMPSSVIREESAVEEIREQRAQAAAQQQQMETMNQGVNQLVDATKAMENMSNTNISGQNALEALTGGLGNVL